MITPEFGGIAELEPAACCITHMLALGFDFVSQHAQLFTHQLFHQIGLETFTCAGKVFLPEVDRAAQHGLPDRHTGLQLAV